MEMKNLLIDASVPGESLSSYTSQGPGPRFWVEYGESCVMIISEWQLRLSVSVWEGGREVVFVDVDNVALIFMLVMSFLGTTNMNIKQIGNIKKANIQH